MANTTKNEEQKEETVSVPKSQLDAIIKRQEEQERVIENLRKAADKGRLERAEAQNRGEEPLKGRVSLFGEQIVVGWKMKRNFVGKNQNGVWVEDQIVTVTTEDGKEYDMAYVDFVKINKVPCEFVAEIMDEYGVVSKKCRLSDGRELFINVDYVN